MITTPLLQWTNTPNGNGPVATVALNFSADNVQRVMLKGGILDKPVYPVAVANDSTFNTNNVSITINGTTVPVSADTRQNTPIPQGTPYIDYTAPAGTTNLTFYADVRDVPPDTPNYTAIIQATAAAVTFPLATKILAGSALIAATDVSKFLESSTDNQTYTLPQLATLKDAAIYYFGCGANLANGFNVTANAADNLLNLSGTTLAGSQLLKSVGESYAFVAIQAINTWFVIGLGARGLTQAMFDASTSFATDQFVQNALGNLSGTTQYSNATANLIVAQMGEAIVLGGGGINNIGLPLLNTVTNGASVLLVSQGSLGVISRQGGDNIIVSGTIVSSFSMGAGDWCLVTRLSAVNWQVTAASFLSGIGVGQTWQDVTASRSTGTTFTNSTLRPIMVMVSSVFTATLVKVGGNTIAQPNTTQENCATFIVPAGFTYSVSGIAAFQWTELR